MKLYNTLTKTKETLTKSKPFLMYTCGPTVYDFAHIGNYRTFIAEDILRRSLLYFGFEIKQVMNITDVDDKTIRGANEKKKSLQEYTKPYIDAFFEDLETLNIQKVEHYPKATDYLESMIGIVQILLLHKIAYKGVDGSIYFSLKAFPSYGKLSHLKLQDLQKTKSRHLSDEYDKENATDFVLWKAHDPKRDGNIFWPSPFGNGRPGWHLECSAMAIELLGKTIDLHAGGVDNIFPHHENEIAQSESFTNQQFVKHWFHVTHLQVDGKKMSKSADNYYTLRDLLKHKFKGRQVRYLLLSSHYRMPLNFTVSGLNAAKQSLQRIDSFLKRLEDVQNEKGSKLFALELEKAEKGFDEALLDDLNMAQALSYLFDFIRSTNQLIDEDRLDKAQAIKGKEFIEKIDVILGILPHKSAPIPQKVLDLANQRVTARNEKNFALSDQLREQIHREGYLIEDKPGGFDLTKTE